MSSKARRMTDAMKKSSDPDEIEAIAAEGKKRQNRPDRLPEVNPGDNRRFILFSLSLADLPKIDMTDLDQVNERIRTYFEMAAEADMKPSVASLAVAFGISRAWLYQIVNGNVKKYTHCIEPIKKAVQILDAQMVDYMQNGKINPVSGIFLMKNNFGYKDQSEIVVKPSTEMQNGDPAEIRERYLDSVVAPALPEASSPFDAIEVEFVDEVAEGAESAE